MGADGDYSHGNGGAAERGVVVVGSGEREASKKRCGGVGCGLTQLLL